MKHVKTYLTFSVVLILLPAAARTVFAQAIIEREDAKAYGWSVSFSRNDDPNNFAELHSLHGSKEAAMASARRFQATAITEGGFGVAKILVEGPSDGSGSVGGPGLPGWSPVSSEFRRNLDETTKKVWDERSPGLEGAFNRAKELKEWALSAIPKLTSEQFAKVNGAIGDFNGQIDALRNDPNGAGLVGFPKLTFVDADSLKQADDWREAVKEQFELEDENGRIVEEQRQLDEERNAIMEEKQNVRDIEAQVTRMRNRAAEANLEGRSAAGTWNRPGGSVPYAME